MSSWLLRLNDRVQGEHLTSQSSWTAAWLYVFGLPTCFLCHPMIELMRSCGSADVRIALIKSQNARGASHQPGFMVSCLTIGMVGYHFHCISWLALFFSTFPPPLWPPFSMTQLKQFCGCHHSWLHWQNYSDPTPTFLQPFTWFRLCQSSKDNVPGYILSLAYILAAWWAQLVRMWLILDIVRNRWPESENQDTINNSLWGRYLWFEWQQLLGGSNSLVPSFCTIPPVPASHRLQQLALI